MLPLDQCRPVAPHRDDQGPAASVGADVVAQEGVARAAPCGRGAAVGALEGKGQGLVRVAVGVGRSRAIHLAGAGQENISG